MVQSDSDDSITLAFSGKYDVEHAQYYLEKHQSGFWRQLSNWRDQQVARKALHIAGNPRTVLDVPCGTGRFWEVLAEDPERVIHACDYSQSMIDAGLANRSPILTNRVKTFQASAFDLPVPDNFVDSIFCIRFMHHLGEREDRLKLLKEFYRVSRDTAIVSLWVDGNFKSWKRQRAEKRRETRTSPNRFLIPASTMEAEFAASGFAPIARLDFFRYYHMWRTYVLCKVLD